MVFDGQSWLPRWSGGVVIDWIGEEELGFRKVFGMI